MAVFNQEKSHLKKELDKVKEELKELRNKYELLLESSASYFFIFEGNDVIEFSPKAEDKFVFASDFADKTVEELLPIFQVSGEDSKKTWQYNIKKCEHDSSEPFDFEFINKNGQPFQTICTLSKLKDDQFLAHLDLLEGQSSQHSFSQEAINDQAPVFIRLTDDKNKTTYQNKGWVNLISNSKKTTKDDWIEIIHSEDLGQYTSTVDYSFKQQKKFEISFRVDDGNGKLQMVGRKWHSSVLSKQHIHRLFVCSNRYY